MIDIPQLISHEERARLAQGRAQPGDGAKALATIDWLKKRLFEEHIRCLHLSAELDRDPLLTPLATAWARLRRRLIG